MFLLAAGNARVDTVGCCCLGAKEDVCPSPMHNTLVINVDIGETRVALIEARQASPSCSSSASKSEARSATST